MVCHLDVARSILERCNLHGVGRVGCNLLGAELCSENLDIREVEIHRHIGRSDVAHGVYLRLTNLSLDAERAVDILLRSDCPLVVLIQRQVYIQGVTQVECTREGDIHLCALSNNDISNVYLTNIRSLLEFKLHGVILSVYRRSRLETLGLEAHNIELNNGIWDIVLDATTEHEHKGSHAQKTKYITHNSTSSYCSTNAPQCQSEYR